MKMYKTSITKRLFLYITAMVLGISTLILLSNTLLLRPLYHTTIKTAMLSTMQALIGIDYTQDEDALREQIGVLDVGNSYDIMIRDGENILYSTSPEFGLKPGKGSGQMPREAPGSKPAGIQNDSSNSSNQIGPDGSENLPDNFRKAPGDFEDSGNGVYIGTVREPKSDMEMMVCTKKLDSGITIIVTQAVEPINKSVQQANILLLACAVLTLAVSLFIVFKVSKSFTRPIRQIQNAVGELAALNFSGRCDVKTGDELQSLGDDVNSLGDKLKKALDTLKEQNEQLEKDIIAQRQFISNASHELRTPLSLIKGYADEINAGFVRNDQQKDLYIEIIAEEAAKMSRLLKEMLDLTRMESGHTEIISERLSVKETILSFLDKYDGFIVQNGLHISLEAADNHIGFFDAMRFEQILANYISNAARYGDSRKKIRIWTRAEEETIRISVFNTGAHLSEELMDSIWSSFYKADDARTRVQDSYGLGLSVVKAIQTVLKQRCGVKNVEDGVEFWFEVKRLRE